jgi:hypothetical protein
MALVNTIVWIFSPDIRNTFERADLAHTENDNQTRWPANKRFDPADATLPELQRAAIQYFGLTRAQVDELTGLQAVAIQSQWSHKAVQILIGIHSAFAGANESRIPALGRRRLASLRTGNPNIGVLL